MSAFQNELQYCRENVCINSGDDAASLCKNLVNFSPVIPEIMRVECAIFAYTRTQFANPP